MTPSRTAFGPFEIDCDRSILLRDGVAVPVGQRAVAVLASSLSGVANLPGSATELQIVWKTW